MRALVTHPFALTLMVLCARVVSSRLALIVPTCRAWSYALYVRTLVRARACIPFALVLLRPCALAADFVLVAERACAPPKVLFFVRADPSSSA